MEKIDCIICTEGKPQFLFSRASRDGELFNLMKCLKCGLEYVTPRPTVDEIGKYYESDYFSKRTDRGYNNYFSKTVKDEIERVFTLNLRDLGFFEFEKKNNEKKTALDIGCAAGYFVNFLKQRGWISSGIDVSRDCVNFAKKTGLDVEHADYLSVSCSNKFNLVTLWASIEHLHHPHLFLKKIYDELEDDGHLYISTCRAGLFNFKSFFRDQWRFYNFPEHLFFFTYGALKKILKKNGFKIIRSLTYGSGVGRSGSLKRKAADSLAKKFKLGDMMIISAVKIQ